MTPIYSVGVLPWLALTATIDAGDVIFIPGSEAAKYLGERSAVLENRLAIYRDTWTGKPVDPTIALVKEQIKNGGAASPTKISKARNILFIAAAFANDVDGGREVNATTFDLHLQRLGGEVGFMAREVRRRYGYLHIGFPTDHVEKRPFYASSFSGFDDNILRALLSVPESHAWNLFESINWFRRSATDADNIDLAVDLVLMLTAVDFLLAHPESSTAGLDQERIAALLRPFQLKPCCSVRPKQGGTRGWERSHIQTLLHVLNQSRNATVHPNPRAENDRFEYYGFGRRQAPLAWMADRCFFALLLARLWELDALPSRGVYGSYIEAVEEWIFDSRETLGYVYHRVKLRNAVREFLRGRGQSDEDDSSFDETRTASQQRWESEFFAAINPVPPDFLVNLVWEADDGGVIEVRRLGEGSRQDTLAFSSELDEPARMAYATSGYFSFAKVSDEPKTFDKETLTAMDDPRSFLDGVRTTEDFV